MSNYRCMCRDNHEPIGYTRDDESCPLCDALTRAEAAEQRARVLEAELSACRADAKQSLRQVTFDGQTVWGTYYTEDTP